MDKNLTTQQFLELIWGTDVTPSYGYILTEPVKAEGATTKPVWKTTTLSVDALSTAEQIVPKLDARPNTSGLFYMPAILSAPTRDSGNQKRLLRSNNPANNKFKRGFRTFFLDLDCGPGKPYPNQMEGLRALGPFLKAAGLPRCNVIVNSGNGLHLYWVMDEILPFDKWLPMATVLKALCKEHGFKADPTITADVARVLRLPGSHNRKDRDNPRKCTAKQIGPQIASELLRAVLDIGEPKPTLNISSALAGPVSDDLRGSVGSKPSFMKQIVKRCQYFAHIAKNGGADCDEPMWMQTIHVCTFAEDGNEWAHVLSRGHKDYSEGGTEDKLEARRRVRAQQPEVSASRCDTLEDADSTGCDLCNGCEYKGKIKSPMQLGRGEVAAKVAEVAVDDLLLPKGYTRNAEGGIWLTKPGGDGEPLSVPIAPGMAILRLEITYITDRDAEGQVTLHFATNVPRSITLMASEFHTQQLPIQLGKQGFDIVSARDLIAFKEFIMSWIIKLKAAGQVKHGSIRLGWPDYTQGEPPIYANFNLGAISYNVDGTETPSFAAVSTADDTFCARGSRAKWDDAVKLLVQAKQPELMTILAASFASPLMKLADLVGAGVSVYSTASGVGKTSAMRVAQAVWGNPIAGVTSMSDTPTSIIAKAGDINNLPMFWDEVRSSSVLDTVGSTLFSIIQGRDKSRCDKTGKRRDVIPFSTLLVTTSNRSILAAIEESAGSSAAGNARLLEIFIHKPADVPVGGDGIFGALAQNYGHAGIVYVQYIVKNQLAIRKAIEATGAMLRKQSGASNEERFWINTIAALLVGAALAKKLKLVNFDLPTMQQFYFDLLIQARTDTDTFKDSSAAANTLNGVLYSLGSRTFLTDFYRRAGKSSEPTIVSLPANNNQPVAVHAQKEGSIVRIAKVALSETLLHDRNRHGYTAKEFPAALEREGMPARIVQRYFPQVNGGSVQYSRTWVVEIDMGTRRYAPSSVKTVDNSGEEDDG